MLQLVQWLPRSSKLAAASLVELIFAITLIAIIGVSAMPRFLQTSQFKQQVFLQQVINSLAYAQNLAIGTGCHIAVIPNINIITFNLRQNCTSGAFNQAVFDPKNINNLFVVTAPANISIGATNFPIYFDVNGLSHRVSNNAIIDALISINGKIIMITGNTGLISQ